jgi:hypothetical protein
MNVWSREKQTEKTPSYEEPLEFSESLIGVYMEKSLKPNPLPNKSSAFSLIISNLAFANCCETTTDL